MARYIQQHQSHPVSSALDDPARTRNTPCQASIERIPRDLTKSAPYHNCLFFSDLSISCTLADTISFPQHSPLIFSSFSFSFSFIRPSSTTLPSPPPSRIHLNPLSLSFSTRQPISTFISIAPSPFFPSSSAPLLQPLLTSYSFHTPPYPTVKPLTHPPSTRKPQLTARARIFRPDVPPLCHGLSRVYSPREFWRRGKGGIALVPVLAGGDFPR